jgi:hypothetical protein
VLLELEELVLEDDLVFFEVDEVLLLDGVFAV